jgi:hypothetical protein
LARTALSLCSPTATLRRSIEIQIVVGHDTRITAPVPALFVIEATVTLLANLDDFVAAKGALADLEAIALLCLVDGIEDVRDVPD